MKREVVVYDYADMNVPVLEKMLQRRLRGYAAIGYRLDSPDEQLLPLMQRTFANTPKGIELHKQLNCSVLRTYTLARDYTCARTLNSRKGLR